MSRSLKYINPKLQLYATTKVLSLLKTLKINLVLGAPNFKPVSFLNYLTIVKIKFSYVL